MALSDSGAQFSQIVRNALDKHGYTFQYAILEYIKTLARTHDLPIVFEVAEFPVAVGSRETKIDFVLRTIGKTHFFVAECKRADPAFARWCFFRAPFVGRNSREHAVLTEQVMRGSADDITSSSKAINYRRDKTFHLGIAVPTQKKGDGGGNPRKAIEDAMNQVMLGVNGLVGHFASDPFQLVVNQPTVLLPVVFTTAELHVSDVDLTNAELETGKLRDDLSLERTDWLLFRYHQSSSHRHSFAPRRGSADLSSALDADFARTVAVVSVDGIKDFLYVDW